jgi:hypothetical protein
MRSSESPAGIIDRWFGARQVRGSRVIQASKEDLRHTLDQFLVAGNLLEAIRRGTDLLLYRPVADWIRTSPEPGPRYLGEPLGLPRRR